MTGTMYKLNDDGSIEETPLPAWLYDPVDATPLHAPISVKLGATPQDDIWSNAAPPVPVAVRARPFPLYVYLDSGDGMLAGTAEPADIGEVLGIEPIIAIDATAHTADNGRAIGDGADDAPADPDANPDAARQPDADEHPAADEQPAADNNAERDANADAVHDGRAYRRAIIDGDIPGPLVVFANRDTDDDAFAVIDVDGLTVGYAGPAYHRAIAHGHIHASSFF